MLLSSCQPQFESPLISHTQSALPLLTVTATATIRTLTIQSTSTILAEETSTVTATPIPPNLTPRPTYTHRPAITPTAASPTLTLDGWLVFSSIRLDTNGDSVINLQDGRHLYTFELATGKVTAITSGGHRDLEPSWSPDRHQIVFASNRFENGTNDSFDLFVINRDGSNLRQLTNIAESARNPVWSPDGKYIAFDMIKRLDTGVNHYQIGLYFVADGRVQQLTSSLDTFEDNQSPAWSPDGRYLAFSAWEKSLLDSSRYVGNVHLIAIDTFEQFRLERDDELLYDARNPIWVPGEKQIITWEYHSSFQYSLDMLLFEIEWQENKPILKQLPVVLTDLWDTPVWTTDGEWVIYVMDDQRKTSDEWFRSLEIAAAPVNLPYQLTVNDGTIRQISLFLDIGQFLTDNEFLDSDLSWTPP